MVLPHRTCGFAAGAAPIPVYGWDLIRGLKPNHARRVRGKVAAGSSPAAHAMLVRPEGLKALAARGLKASAGMIGCRCDNFIQRIEVVPPDF